MYSHLTHVPSPRTQTTRLLGPGVGMEGEQVHPAALMSRNSGRSAHGSAHMPFWSKAMADHHMVAEAPRDLWSVPCHTSATSSRSVTSGFTTSHHTCK